MQAFQKKGSLPADILDPIAMKTSVFLVSLGIAASALSSCSQYQDAKIQDNKKIVHVLDERSAALARSRNSKNGINFVEYTAALRTIDISGCDQKFQLAWRNYVNVIASKRGFGILSGASNILAAEDQLEGAAIDAGVTFNFTENR